MNQSAGLPRDGLSLPSLFLVCLIITHLCLVDLIYGATILWPTKLSDASEAYRNNEFARAIAMVQNALNVGDLTPGERARALALRGLCNANLGKHDAAVSDFYSALELDQLIRVEGVEFIPSEVQDFSIALGRYTEKHPQRIPGGGSHLKWQVYAGGGILAGGLAYLLSRLIHTNQPSPLPDLPGPPGR